MRSKSTRKEALWRQRTLHAAYTVSCAKQSINKIAAIIVDEIVNAIKHFANPTRWEQLTVAVRRIVKTAAETWRYARLEIAMITASMSEEDRPEFMRSKGVVGLTTAIENASSQRQMLLPLFPIVEREAIHEDIRQESKVNDQGYIYFPGCVLYADDPAVTACLAETQPNDVTTKHTETIDTMLQVGKKKMSPNINAESKKLEIKPIEYTSISQQLDSKVTDPPSALIEIRSDSWGEIGVNGKMADKNLTNNDNKRKASNDSSNRTPPLSHSSETSGSSTWRSSSTTRPDGLPNWGNKGGIDRGGYGRW